MSIVERPNDRVSIPSADVQPNEGLNLLSLRRPEDRPIQVASLANDLTMLASRSTVAACDVLFNVQTECRQLQDHLRNNPDVRNPQVGRMVENILNNGIGPLGMRVDRLNDYLKDVGVKASLDKSEERLTLVNERTGAKVVYAVGPRTTPTPRQ